MAKREPIEGIEDPTIHIRPRKGNELLKEEIKKLADNLGRSKNEVGEKILTDYFKNPHKLTFGTN